MSTQTNEAQRQKLNENLDANTLRLWVPINCDFLPEHERPENIYHSHPRHSQGDTGDCIELIGAEAIEHARRVHDRVHRRALRLPGVSAVDVGFAVRELDKIFENTLAIRIHVTKKLSRRELRRLGKPNLTSPNSAENCPEDRRRTAPTDPSKPANAADLVLQIVEAFEGEDPDRGAHPLGTSVEYRLVMPPVGQSPVSDDGQYCCKEQNQDKPECRIHICGVPLDVVRAEYFPTGHGVFVDELQPSRELSDEEARRTGRGRINVLVGGISVGNEGGQAGTLGAVVWDRTDGCPCLLSNFHVLAGSLPANVGQPCYQPALFDGGSPEDEVAKLKRWRLDDGGDIGIAELSSERFYAGNQVLGIWDPITEYHPPTLNLEVRKFGRTTGFTQGFIDGLYLATNIDYGNGVFRFFKDQFHIAPLYADREFSQVGDSGSLVLTSQRLDRHDLYRSILKKIGVAGEIPDDILIGCPEEKELLGLIEQHDLEDICKLLGLACQEDLCDVVSEPDELERKLKDLGFDVDGKKRELRERKDRHHRRSYRVVGMLFAGDTAGSPFGEFALATDFKTIEEKLQISLSPVFEPRSSFRELREDGPPGRAGRRGRQRLEPGQERSDERGTGPQPDPDPLSSGPG